MTAGPPLPSVPIHSSPALTTPVPSEVAKTVLAPSGPRSAMISRWSIDEPVGLGKVSTVRAKSWLPLAGTVTSHVDGRPVAVA